MGRCEEEMIPVPRKVIEVLTIEKFDLYWPLIERELKTIPQFWEDHWTLEAIYNLTSSGRWQCWGVGLEDIVEVTVFTQVVDFPASKVFQVILAFGRNIDEYIEELNGMFEGFARNSGC